MFTVLLLPACVWAAYSLMHWALATADWTAVTSNIKVMMVGTFPVEMLGRAWGWVMSLSFLAGATMGTVVTARKRLMVACAVTLAVCAVFAAQMNGTTPVNIVACAALAVGGLWLTSRVPALRKWLGLVWFIELMTTGVLLLPAGFDKLGGLMLGVLMTLLASALSIPLGFLLAFGRRSKMAGLRVICVGYIEVMRSLPLILIVYWIWIVTPLVAPSFSVPDALRGLLGFSLFFAAYVAEYVRSGFQAVPKGQTEAAASLGMTQGQINRDIVLPQALRVVTPALVGNVLDIFNNVPLLFIIGLTEFLRAGQMVLANPQSASKTYEIYAFMFIVYLGAASLITYGARRLEARMATGHR
ncbi:amino acid ABC transporter permease [Variovorax ureilyticus]|uniref:Amino acid ABC transporter permease n=1 Tax=Variovorax ureilyticus TaxID=1836198 RepID=A0ABU8VMD6_9BURK